MHVIRKHWRAVLTLLGLISCVYRDLHHWRSNQGPHKKKKEKKKKKKENIDLKQGGLFYFLIYLNSLIFSQGQVETSVYFHAHTRLKTWISHLENAPFRRKKLY